MWESRLVDLKKKKRKHMNFSGESSKKHSEEIKCREEWTMPSIPAHSSLRSNDTYRAWVQWASLYAYSPFYDLNVCLNLGSFIVLKIWDTCRSSGAFVLKVPVTSILHNKVGGEHLRYIPFLVIMTPPLYSKEYQETIIFAWYFYVDRYTVYAPQYLCLTNVRTKKLWKFNIS